MRVFTPVEIAKQAGNKYVGVLVAAKFARFVNDFPRDRNFQYEKKLTTTSLEELSSGALTYKITRRRRQDA
jgi:DNA-directed RNA polymerase subunit K/omega